MMGSSTENEGKICDRDLTSAKVKSHDKEVVIMIERMCGYSMG